MERFGTFIDSYDNIVCLLHTIQARNHGTHVDIKHYVLPEISGFKVLHRVFFSFAICIEAFRHCHFVLCVDGTFLTDKYKGQVLILFAINKIAPFLKHGMGLL